MSSDPSEEDTYRMWLREWIRYNGDVIAQLEEHYEDCVKRVHVNNNEDVLSWFGRYKTRTYTMDLSEREKLTLRHLATYYMLELLLLDNLRTDLMAKNDYYHLILCNVEDIVTRQGVEGRVFYQDNKELIDRVLECYKR